MSVPALHPAHATGSPPGFAQPDSIVHVAPAVLPLERLQVVQLIFAAFGDRALVSDLPPKPAVCVPVTLAPNERAMRICPHRRMVAAEGRPAPDRFNDCFIERPASCIGAWLSEHTYCSVCPLTGCPQTAGNYHGAL